MWLFFFFFMDTTTTEIYTLSLHDALPISSATRSRHPGRHRGDATLRARRPRSLDPATTRGSRWRRARSEEHTSELQSQSNLVCRLLLEKKKKTAKNINDVTNTYIE